MAHKNLGLFEHDGVLMALDWAVPAMVMPLHAVDDWANRPPETIRGALVAVGETSVI